MLISVMQIIVVCFLNVIGVAESQSGNIVIIDIPMAAFCSGDFIFISEKQIAREHIVEHEYMHMKQYSRLREKYFLLVAVPSLVSHWINYLAIETGSDLEYTLAVNSNMPWEKHDYLQ